MPYKDAIKRKEVARVSMEKKRKGLTQGLTTEGVNGKGVNTITFSDDSSVLDLDALERNKVNLVKLISYMKDSKFKQYMKDIRFGVEGPTLDRIGEVLEVTG